MLHFDSRRSQACEDIYGEKCNSPLESLPAGESVRQVYFAGRSRRPGNWRRRYHPHQPEVVVKPPMPAYEPPEIVPLSDSLPEPEHEQELELSLKQQLFLERRMDLVETMAEAVILEAQRLEDDATCWDIV